MNFTFKTICLKISADIIVINRNSSIASNRVINTTTQSSATTASNSKSSRFRTRVTFQCASRIDSNSVRNCCIGFWIVEQNSDVAKTVANYIGLVVCIKVYDLSVNTSVRNFSVSIKSARTVSPYDDA